MFLKIAILSAALVASGCHRDEDRSDKRGGLGVWTVEDGGCEPIHTNSGSGIFYPCGEPKLYEEFGQFADGFVRYRTCLQINGRTLRETCVESSTGGDAAADHGMWIGAGGGIVDRPHGGGPMETSSARRSFAGSGGAGPRLLDDAGVPVVLRVRLGAPRGQERWRTWPRIWTMPDRAYGAGQSTPPCAPPCASGYDDATNEIYCACEARRNGDGGD